MVAAGNKDLDTCAISQILHETIHYQCIKCLVQQRRTFFIYHSCDFVDDFEYDFSNKDFHRISQSSGHRS